MIDEIAWDWTRAPRGRMWTLYHWAIETIRIWRSRFCLQHAHIHVLADFFQYQISNTSPTQQNSMGPGLALWPRLHKTTYWPLILMALCIIDFIGANGLLGSVWGRGPGHAWAQRPRAALVAIYGPRSDQGPLPPLAHVIHSPLWNLLYTLP